MCSYSTVMASELAQHPKLVKGPFLRSPDTADM